jgi:hypothetical protein
MNKQQNMEERLWEYIDGACAPEERLFIDELVATNTEWKNKYQELLELHQLLGNNLELDEPSMRFTQNVMEQISQLHITPAARTYINKRIIQGIAAFFILTIAGFFIYGAGQIHWSQGTGASIIPANTLDKIHLDKLPVEKIDFNKLMNAPAMYIFMMVNAVLGLVCLDMYLGGKRKKLSAKQ